MTDDGTDYEYRGLKAQAWDLLRGDYSTWPDRPFYLAAIRRYGEPVLDVGCGTGRLLLDYMQQGVDIDGVDNSPEMLALCAEKGRELGLEPRVYQQRMEQLELLRRYRTVLVPSSSFLLLTDPAHAREAMRRFHAHLEPGGALIMPFIAILPVSPPPDGAWTDWFKDGKARRPDGAIVRRFQRVMFEIDAQLAHDEYRYELLRDGAVVHEETHLTSPATRWYTQAQSIAVFTDAGFTVAAVTEGFTEAPAPPESRMWTVFGLRA